MKATARKWPTSDMVRRCNARLRRELFVALRKWRNDNKGVVSGTVKAFDCFLNGSPKVGT